MEIRNFMNNKKVNNTFSTIKTVIMTLLVLEFLIANYFGYLWLSSHNVELSNLAQKEQLYEIKK